MLTFISVVLFGIAALFLVRFLNTTNQLNKEVKNRLQSKINKDQLKTNGFYIGHIHKENALGEKVERTLLLIFNTKGYVLLDQSDEYIDFKEFDHKSIQEFIAQEMNSIDRLDHDVAKYELHENRINMIFFDSTLKANQIAPNEPLEYLQLKGFAEDDELVLDYYLQELNLSLGRFEKQRICKGIRFKYNQV